MSGILTSGLNKSYGRKGVLRNLTFSAPEGKATLLAGLNGAGKTTWIRTALGLASADSGSVLFAGRGIVEARHKVGVVLDEPPVYPLLTGEENLYALSGGVQVPSDLRSRVLDMLALTPDFLKMRGRAFSLGQRRRLAVAVALFRQPRFLFLDEPTIGLDPVARGMVRQAMQALNDEGCTIVLTGQDFSEFSTLIDHVVVLHGGLALYDGEAADLTRRRPPRVWVETADSGHAAFTDWSHVSRDGVNRYGLRCDSWAEAQSLLGSVRSWDIPVTGMGIEEDSLEEAFLSIVKGSQGSQHG